ncbi:hypothetical protein GGR03_000624 [Aurantimonas endophytica]|uniref:Uncharacterized protein n=1 Tax=Aurantimonas endophytica TaxID=1522175 RepID=A0A7W6MN79_9HYPH|nr:hypothetical protein [Aurantimonas endophytica]
MHQYEPVTLWHLADQMLLHNAWIGKGYADTFSELQEMPGLSDVTTRYAFHTSQADERSSKEDAWETVRREQFDHLPSRRKALFAFMSREDAERAALTWGGDLRDRVPVRLHYLPNTLIHVADSRLLDCQPVDWRQRALIYWRGECSANPLKEVILHGRVYFPDWESSPFGLMETKTPGKP